MVNWRGFTNWHLLMKNIHKFNLYCLPWLITIKLMYSWERIVSLDLLQYVWYIIEGELPPLACCNISDIFMWENCLPCFIAIYLIYSWVRIVFPYLLQYIWCILEGELYPLTCCSMSDIVLMKNCLHWLVAIYLIYSWRRIASPGILQYIWFYYCYQSIQNSSLILIFYNSFAIFELNNALILCIRFTIFELHVAFWTGMLIAILVF